MAAFTLGSTACLVPAGTGVAKRQAAAPAAVCSARDGSHVCQARLTSAPDAQPSSTFAGASLRCVHTCFQYTCLSDLSHAIQSSCAGCRYPGQRCEPLATLNTPFGVARLCEHLRHMPCTSSRSPRPRDFKLTRWRFRVLLPRPHRLAPLRGAARAHTVVVHAAASASGGVTFSKVSEVVTNLFPVWTVIGALVGLYYPSTFAAVDTKYFTAILAALMLSMGITLTLKDFQDCLSKPIPVAVNFIACYVLMPALAFAISKFLALSPALMAGLVLVGSINGGQASNLCTYIARGDVALSVVMTTSTTIGCIFMTPLIAKAVLGTIVPVDPVGIAVSTIQVVLLPVLVGVIANATVPKVCRAVEPYSPLVGVAATVVLVGASVAQCSTDIVAAGLGLQWPLFLLHLFGGVAGYWFTRLCGQTEKVCRTVAIETAMKSSAFGFLLASLHFKEYLVRVPSAISVVWMAVLGASLAVFWRFQGTPE